MTRLFAAPSLAALSLVVLLAGCVSDRDSRAARDPENRRQPLQVWNGVSSVADQYFVRLAQTNEDWEFFWTYTKRPPPRPLAEGREVAAFVFLGQRPTGGYSVTIDALYVDGEKAGLAWTEIEPGAGDLVTDALTYPWAIALFVHDGSALRLVELGPAVEGGGEAAQDAPAKEIDEEG